MSGFIERNHRYSSSGFSPSGGFGKVLRTGSAAKSSGGKKSGYGGNKQRGKKNRRPSSSSKPRRRLLEGVNQAMLSKILVAIAVLVVVGVGALLISIAAHSSSRQIAMSVIDSDESESVITAEDAGSTVRIALGGSIKLQDEILAAAKAGDNTVSGSSVSYNFDNYLSEVKQVMSADLSIVNMMGAIASDGMQTAGYPAPEYPVEVVRALRNIGVTHAVTANKAVLSNGASSLDNTIRALADSDISALGAKVSSTTGDRAYVKRVNSINVGIAAYNCLTDEEYKRTIESEKEKGFSEDQLSTCVNQLSMSETRNEDGKSYSAASDAITADVQAMRAAGAQYIIICIDWDPLNWNFEDGRLPDAMTNLAQRMIDIGVDVTVGYGIDMPQRITVKPYTGEDGVKKNCYFFYSLGNLLSDCNSGKTQTKQESFVVNITLTRNPDSKKVDSSAVVYHPMYTLHDTLYETENTYFKYRVVPAMLYKGANPGNDASLKALVNGCNTTCNDLKNIIESTASNRNGSVTETAVGLGQLKSATTETTAPQAVGGNDSL